MTQRLYTISETSSTLGISRSTVYAMIRAREIHTVPFRGRKRIPRSEVCRLIGTECAKCAMRDTCEG
jgi:excisionase family DNA binding protein